jgi:protein-disulfide isomerase
LENSCTKLTSDHGQRNVTSLFDRITSAILTVSAVAIAVVLVHRELSPARPEAPFAAPPSRVKNWSQVLASGTLMGRIDAPVKIVEFGDFECPFCRKFATAYEGVKQAFGSNVTLVFVDDPLTMHRFAAPAARAAQCAASQGRFDAFYKVVYQKQDSLGLKPWSSFAYDAQVPDTTRFTKCNQASGPVHTVVLGKALATKLGVNGTPTILINGWRLSSPPDDSTLEHVVAGTLHGVNVRDAITKAQHQ